jgi:hypothetical protein
MRAVLALVAFCACGEPRYVYTPETANAALANRPASRTPIPQESPQGAVQVASYGFSRLQDLPALHVRMIVSNDGDPTPWLIDTREQYVSIPGEGRSRAAYVSSDVQNLPIVQIPQHERRTFDFYFPLPSTVHRASDLPRFDVQWQIATPSRLVASSTAFDRIEQPEESASGPYWAGYAPYWWYDPLYPQVVFVHARPWHHRGYR